MTEIPWSGNGGYGVLNGAFQKGAFPALKMEIGGQLLMEPQIHRQRRPRHRQAHQNSGQNHGVTAQPAPFGRPAGLELTPARVGVKGCPARLPGPAGPEWPDGVWGPESPGPFPLLRLG